MEISKKSWHFWVYSHFYMYATETYWLPKNLCPYFWKLMLALVLFIPLTIFLLPYTLLTFVISLIDKEEEFSYPVYVEDFFKGLFTNFGGFLLFVMVDMWWCIPTAAQFKSGKESPIFMFGVICWVILITLGITQLCIKIKEGIQKRKRIKRPLVPMVELKIKQPNIFVEFIKAKYKKHCPMIQWKD